MLNKNKIIYSINVEDVQTVAMQEFDKVLAEEEMKLVEEKIGDYINWYEAINSIMIEIFQKS